MPHLGNQSYISICGAGAYVLILASFPGCFGREKWPGNFREYKLLLPLPESWKTQSDFRSLSHDNSKPNCFMR